MYRSSTSKVVEAMEIGRVEEVENTINVLVVQTGRLGRWPGIPLQAYAITEGCWLQWGTSVCLLKTYQGVLTCSDALCSSWILAWLEYN
jgi:hypothetical protein